MINKTKVNILFTSAGRRVALIRAFKNAYKTLGLNGTIVATDIDPLAPALQIVDQPYLVSRCDSQDYIPQLVKICQRESIDLIFPLIDPDIYILALNRAFLESTRAKVVVIPLESVEKTVDKWSTYQFFREIGIPTPQSWLPSQLPGDLSFPLFIKPRQGSASKGTFKVNNKKELDFFLSYIPKPIIQEYLPGPEITSDVICDFNGRILGVVSRQRREVRWGEVSKGVTVYHKKIVEFCIKIAQKLSAIGPLTIQCILKGEQPYFTEINARFGGGAPLGIAAGADYPKWLLAQFISREIDIPPLGTYQVGLYLTRYDEAFFLNEEQYAKMASCHL